MARIEISFKTVVGRHGTFSYLPNDMFVGRSLDLYGEFSEHETMLFQQLLRPGAVVVEAGANLGALTVPIAKAVGPSGKVIAYEPQPVIAALLRRNVSQNGLAQVEVREAALGSAAGSLRVPEMDYRAVENFGGLSLSADRGSAVPVETIDALKLARLDLIKADVEGMEIEVLEGAAATIARLRPILYVENNRDDRSKRLIATILGFGYRAWWYAAPLFNPDNHVKQPHNVFGDTISINMFCFPQERETAVVGGVPVIGEDDTRDAAGARVRARLEPPRPPVPAPQADVSGRKKRRRR
ncbi:MAG: FkbM family methyltransferase [Proteobacteria bacterium]|nr:FkbM family methyltransferase [Pseudomonadota bacterium]